MGEPGTERRGKCAAGLYTKGAGGAEERGFAVHGTTVQERYGAAYRTGKECATGPCTAKRERGGGSGVMWRRLPLNKLRLNRQNI